MQFELRPVILNLFNRYAAIHPLNHYTGILAMQGLARLGHRTDDDAVLAKAQQALAPFAAGEVEPFGNFRVYRCGGNGTAYLHRHGLWPEAAALLETCASEQMDAPRGDDRIYCRPSPKQLPERRIWIDTAFAVCPFMLDCGVAFDRPEWVDDAVHQILAMYRVFLDPACGLVHQGKNFNGPASISDDHWSRGNGWGLLALAEVVERLPEGHPQRAECRRIFAEWLRAALAVRNYEGLWFQEMAVANPRQTYTETSGSGLILYALGIALQTGVLEPQEARLSFEHGLRALLRFVTVDGNVYHCCTSCCCPGDGSVEAYLKRPPILNDNHAFGPVILALTQALEHGFDVLEPLPDSEVQPVAIYR